MKFLIPNYLAPDSFSENVVFTLQRMGHSVVSLPATDWGSLRMRLYRRKNNVLKRLVREYVSAEHETALALASEHKPEVVLSLTHPLPPSILRDMKLAGVRHRMIWWGDALANQAQLGLLTDEWDYVFSKDPDGVAKLRRVGLNAHLLFEAMNPEWHKPMASRCNDAIAVVGNPYGYRQFLVKRLVDAGFQVDAYGGAPPRWSLPEFERSHLRRIVVKEEKSRIFGEALACLNNMQFSEGNSLNCRTFEVAGAAGLQLIEHRPVIERCFEPGEEILVYDSLPELFGHLERAKKDPRRATEIREAGHRRALAEHTYRHRIQQIEKLLGSS